MKPRQGSTAVSCNVALGFRQEDQERGEHNHTHAEQKPEDTSKSPSAVQCTADDGPDSLASYPFQRSVGIQRGGSCTCTYRTPAFVPMNPPRSPGDAISAITRH